MPKTKVTGAAVHVGEVPSGTDVQRTGRLTLTKVLDATTIPEGILYFGGSPVVPVRLRRW